MTDIFFSFLSQPSRACRRRRSDEESKRVDGFFSFLFSVATKPSLSPAKGVTKGVRGSPCRSVGMLFFRNLGSARTSSSKSGWCEQTERESRTYTTRVSVSYFYLPEQKYSVAAGKPVRIRTKYLVDPASSICLSQRLSHACLSTSR